jgi:transposase InsO family protein
VQDACRVLGYSKQGYYKSIERRETKAFEEYLIVELIRQKRTIWKKGSGRNLFACLQGDFALHGIGIGRDKFFRLLRENGLLVRRKSRRARTTNSYHHYHRFPNLIEGLNPDGPNQVWVADITFVWCRKEQSFLYLFLITDMYSRKVVGYALGQTLEASWAVQALQMGISNQGTGSLEGLIHHSDRGIQYCCGDYTGLLFTYKIQPSMTQNSDPLENPIAERINLTLKDEFMDNYKDGYQNKAQAMKEIPVNIAFYNQVRPHSSVERLTPNQAHSRTGPLERKWKNYYSKKTVL